MRIAGWVMVASLVSAAVAQPVSATSTGDPRVAEVTVVTGDDLPLDALRDALGWPIGSRLDEETIRAGLERLRALPLLVPPVREDVTVTPREDGAHVEVRVARRPPIHDISFHGLFPIFDREARNALRMRIGDPYDAGELPAEVARLERLAERKGFLGTRCEGSSEPSEHRSVDLTYTCDRAPWLTVRDVTVEGASAMPASHIDHVVRPWFFFDEEDFQMRLDRVRDEYREKGYVRARVASGGVDPDPRTENVDLRVRVEERKPLTVHFVGNHALDEDDLQEVLPFAREGSYGLFLVQEGGDAVRKAYQRAGYPDARVATERNELPDRVEVLYRIDEGEPRSVGRVRFVGNHAIPGHELRKLVQSRKHRWLVLAPRLQDDVLEGDRVAIEEEYRARGYVGVHVDPAQRQVVGDEIALLFPIDEGPLARIGDVTFANVPDAVRDAVPKGVPVVVGEPYVAERVERWRQELETAFGVDGHLRAVVGIGEVWSADSSAVALMVSAVPGTHFVVGPVFTLGGENVDDELIDRSIYLKTGRDLTPESIVKTHEDLRELDVFESIRVRPVGLGNTRVPGATPSPAAAAPAEPGASAPPAREPAETAIEAAAAERAVPVVVELRQRPNLRFDVGPSYDTDRGAAGHFTLEVLNLMGRAIEARVDGTYGQDDRQASVTFTDPRFLLQHLRGSLMGSYKDQNFPAFDREEIEGGAEIKRSLAPKLVGTLGLTYRISDISNVTSFDPEAPEEGITRELVWSSGVVRDTRNDLLYPTRGQFLAGSVGVAARTLVSDDDFVRLDFQARHYQELTERVIGVLSVRFTDVELYGVTDEVPAPELLFAGGASSVRGFEEDRVGRLDAEGRPLGGGARFLASAELRFPAGLDPRGSGVQ
ncbi:MAG: BamA/TamA family outer membrane protein [Deltaproteobacteria bacterium]|nr:BamA/TamA family outer membrane protein [Deltaproteobacteria bacterium]